MGGLIKLNLKRLVTLLLAGQKESFFFYYAIFSRFGVIHGPTKISNSINHFRSGEEPINQGAPSG